MMQYDNDQNMTILYLNSDYHLIRAMLGNRVPYTNHPICPSVCLVSVWVVV